MYLMATESAGRPFDFTRAAIKNSTSSTSSTTPAFQLEDAVYPSESLIEDYADYARERLESADSYLVGAILPVIAACLGRRVYFTWGDERIYPNLCSMLAGNAGERKSSAVNLPEKIAKPIQLIWYCVAKPPLIMSGTRAPKMVKSITSTK